MLDPGRGGGGQISNLISDDGKSPKVLLCHLHSVDILCECRWLVGIEILSGAKLNFNLSPSSSFPLSPFPHSSLFFPLPFSLTLFFPAHHVRNARSRLEFSFRPVFPLPLLVCLSVCCLILSLGLYLVFPPLALSPCSDLFFFVRQSSFSTLSQIITDCVSEKVMCI